CSGSVNLDDFEEVWQYGCNELKDDIWEQDGVAPQCGVKISNFAPLKAGRIYIPIGEEKGFVTSHTIVNYGWIFNKIIDGKIGFVKKRN
ncbi:MAG: hypothetical protein ABI315_06530, partial [Bacteroidia bacterium]